MSSAGEPAQHIEEQEDEKRLRRKDKKEGQKGSAEPWSGRQEWHVMQLISATSALLLRARGPDQTMEPLYPQPLSGRDVTSSTRT